jgi:alpha-beta hydrolase superfamily lysophospholipase
VHQGIKELERLADKIDVPVYMVHGARDAVTSRSAASRFIEAVSSKDKKFDEVTGEGGFSAGGMPACMMLGIWCHL